MTKFLKMNMIITTLSRIIEDNVADFTKENEEIYNTSGFWWMLNKFHTIFKRI